MRHERALKHEFVEFIPDALDEGTVYVSVQFATVVHKCGCGCGKEVVTPLSPTDWRLIFDGKTISLHPSIGNWSFECQSHYWIRGSTVKWATGQSREEIEAGRSHDRIAKESYFDASGTAPNGEMRDDASETSETARAAPGLRQKLKTWKSQLRGWPRRSGSS